MQTASTKKKLFKNCRLVKSISSLVPMLYSVKTLCDLRDWDWSSSMKNTDLVSNTKKPYSDLVSPILKVQQSIWLRVQHRFQEHYTWPCLVYAVISVIATPPPGRISIQTRFPIHQRNFAKQRRFELQRGGQIFLRTQRRERAYRYCNHAPRALTQYTIEVASGQHTKKHIERVMLNIWEGKTYSFGLYNHHRKWN